MELQDGRTGARLGLLALFLGGLLVSACGDGSTPSDYEQQVMQARVDRDMSMREKESVLPVGRRDAFRGLDFYAVDPSYRFVRSLDRSTPPDTVLMAESTGGVSTQIRVGSVTVPLPSGTVQLAVFQSNAETPRGRLWIPFADSTNGQTTYEAGRYVDVEPIAGDSVLVDFNRAYNPTCAYNPDFVCPLPPKENRLEGPVPVGEKQPLFAETPSS